jgi:hypothetical protein
MNAAEALARFGWHPACSCDHELGAHNDSGCTGIDSYGFLCSCPSYDVEPDASDPLGAD